MHNSKERAAAVCPNTEPEQECVYCSCVIFLGVCPYMVVRTPQNEMTAGALVY